MQIRDTASNYGFTSIWLHWISAGLVAVLFVSGKIVEDMSRGAAKWELMAVHQSLGMLLFIVVLARLLWRLGQGFPDPVDKQGSVLAKLSRAWHWILLGFLMLIPVSGYLLAETGLHDLNFFGLVALPDVLGTDRDMHEFIEEVHETLSNLLLPLVAVHVLAALKHHYFDRDGTLKRMVSAGYKA